MTKDQLMTQLRNLQVENKSLQSKLDEVIFTIIVDDLREVIKNEDIQLSNAQLTAAVHQFKGDPSIIDWTHCYEDIVKFIHEFKANQIALFKASKQ